MAVAVACCPASLQRYVNGPAPPLIFTLRLPSELPQVGSVFVTERLTEAGSVITTLSVL